MQTLSFETNFNSECIIHFTSADSKSMTVKVKSVKGFAHAHIVGFNETNQTTIPLEDGFSITRVVIGPKNIAKTMTQLPFFGMLTVTCNEGGKLIYNGRTITTFENEKQLAILKSEGVTITT